MKNIFTIIILLIVAGFVTGSAFADYLYYVPYFTSKTGDNTGLGLRNTNTTESAQTSVLVYDQNGSQVMVENKTISANGQTAFLVGQGLNTNGSLRVTSDQPLAILCSVFRGGTGYEVPVTQNLSTSLDIPHAAQDNIWDTSIIVNNPNNSTITVTVTYANSSGQNTASQQDTIPANATKEYELSDILNGSPVSGGSVTISSTQGVTALVTYSTLASGGSFLVGFGPVDPSGAIENFTPTQFAVVATSAADFSSGAHAKISVDKPRVIEDNLLPTISDVMVAAYGGYFYRIERFFADNITKFDVDAPATPIWQFTTMDSEDTVLSSNPQDIVFSSSTKAYLLRFGSPTAWIVDPSAITQADFKIGTLDLSPYADGDGIPEMRAGVIANGKLFIILQRLEDFCPTNTAYVAVFDISTDTEINTGVPNNDGVMGIPLPIGIPLTIQYMSENETVFVQGVGSWPGGFCDPSLEYTGGIVTVDPEMYDTALVLDDGDAANHPYGAISGMEIVSPTQGYFIGYASFLDNSLYSFNPNTGEVDAGTVASLTGKSIPDQALALDKNGMLWVGDNTDAQMVIIDTTDNTVDGTIPVNLNPQNIVFVEP